MSESTLGKTIDLPLEDFKKDIIEQKVPIGVLNNMYLLFNASFNDLVRRKNVLMEKKASGEIEEDITPVVKGIYSEMIKIEQKCTFLVERIDELKPLQDI